MFSVGFRLAQYCDHVHFRDFELFALVACIIWLNNTTLGIWKVICISRIGVLLGNLPVMQRTLFCSSAVSSDDYTPQFPRRDRHYRPNENIVEGQFNVSA
jgi:hypothetical protein